MTVRDSITRARARTPWGGGLPHLQGRCTNEALVPTQRGITEVATKCAKGGHTNHHQPVYAGSRLKPADVAGKVLPYMPAFPAVSGKNPPYGMIGRVEENVGIIRSPVRALDSTRL